MSLLSLVPALVNEITAAYYLRSLAYHIADVEMPDEVALFVGGASLTSAALAVIVIPIGALFLSAIVIHKREWPLTEGV